jgi:glycosyltransferase involved in cell wall biosynthesis
MRIAIVAEPYIAIPPQQYGGIEQVVYFLIKGLMEAGHEPILLAPGDSQVPCRLIPTTPQALQFPKHASGLRAHQAQVRQAHRTTRRKLKALLPEIDLIHSHGFDLTPFSNFPNLTTLHNKIEIADLPYYHKHSNLLYASVSKNHQAANPQLTFMGTVYNGEDPDKFPIVTNPQDYLCFISRFDRDKSPHLAIQLALAHNMKIKLAGKVDHHDDGYFEEEIAPYLDNPLVEYLGELGFEDKVELLSNAKCNLHPTNFREPFGLTVMEAAYCGTPTLAIARGSMPELIEDGRTGILVEDFVEGFHYLEKCFSLDRSYVASRARQLFNYHTMARQYIEDYNRVLEVMPVSKRQTTMLRRFWDQLTERRQTPVAIEPDASL